MWCGLCGFFIIKPQTALHHAVWCTVTCGAVQLCHFAGGFGAVFVVYVVWWTLLISTFKFMLILKFMKTTLKLYTKKEYVITKKKKKKRKKKKKQFWHDAWQLLVKLIFVIKLLSWRLYGCNGVKWNTVNRKKRYDTIALMEFVMGMVFINNRRCYDPNFFI